MARPGPALKLTAPLKVLAQRLAFTGLLGASVGLMVMAKAEAPFVERARMMVADAVVPVLDAIGKPTPPAVTYLGEGRGASILKAHQRLWDGEICPVAAIKVTRHNLLRPTSLVHEAGHGVAAIAGAGPAGRRPRAARRTPSTTVAGSSDFWLRSLVNSR